MRSTLGEALVSGIIGGTLGGVVSAVLNYYLLPFPQTAADNAIGHGMSGFFCGLVSGILGVLAYARRQRSAQRRTES